MAAKGGNKLLVDPFVFLQGRQPGRVSADFPSQALQSPDFSVEITEAGGRGLTGGFQLSQAGFRSLEACLKLGKLGDGLFSGSSALLSLLQVYAAAVEDILGMGQ